MHHTRKRTKAQCRGFAMSLTQEFPLSPCLAQVELTPCKHQAQLTLNCTVCAIPDWIHANLKHQAQLTLNSIVCAILDWIHSNLTDLLHSGTTASKIKPPFNKPFIFINFIFFKLHKRTLFFNYFFPHLFYSNASCREIPSRDEAAFCSDLTRTLTNTILLRRFALWQVSNYQVTPLSSDNMKSIPFSTVPFLYCSNTSSSSFL